MVEIMSGLFRFFLIFVAAFLAPTEGSSTSRLQIHMPQSLSRDGGYEHRDALFGIPPYGGSIHQQVYYADSDLCDSNVDTSKGYPARDIKDGKMEPWKSPYILMVDRGGCTFVQKVRNAQRAGAAAVLIADNTCLCFDAICMFKTNLTVCEEDEPIMADDGSGLDISIPSFLVFKQDADPIKGALKNNEHVAAEMSFSVPSPDARVEYDLWSTPTDSVSRKFFKTFKSGAVALGERASFTPHHYIYDGVRAGCQYGGENKCFNLCTNNGRYCATDPDNNLDEGISGADVVKESLRRICIWNTYGKDGIGKEWWDYVKEFMARCYDGEKTGFFTNSKCISEVMTHAKVDEKEIVNCMEESGGLKGNKTNTELEKQLSAKAAAGVVLIPSLFVNQAPVRGYLKFATVLKAICSGFATGSEPVVCQQCANCEDEGECVRDGFCATSSDGASGGVSFPVFVGTLVGVTLIFGAIGLIQYQRQQRQMRDEVRGIMAEYMPVDEKNNHAINTSLALQEDDGGGQFTIN